MIFYIHGGAYLYGFSQAHWDFFSKLAEQMGYIAVTPDYPLTPQHTYRDAFQMVVPVYEKTVQKYAGKPIILMGDSAGGGMSLALAQCQLKHNGVQPLQIILLSPWLDVAMTNPEIKAVDKDAPFLSVEDLKMAGKAYAGAMI